MKPLTDDQSHMYETAVSEPVLDEVEQLAVCAEFLAWLDARDAEAFEHMVEHLYGNKE